MDDLQAGCGLLVVFVRERRGGLEFATRILGPVEPRKRETEIVMRWLIRRSDANCLRQPFIGIVILLQFEVRNAESR